MPGSNSISLPPISELIPQLSHRNSYPPSVLAVQTVPAQPVSTPPLGSSPVISPNYQYGLPTNTSFSTLTPRTEEQMYTQFPITYMVEPQVAAPQLIAVPIQHVPHLHHGYSPVQQHQQHLHLHQPRGEYVHLPETSLPQTKKQPKKEFKKRTRTGCLTCRRRRIKCDERKPQCFNCEKSKICCAGYQLLRPTKQEMKKTSKVMQVDAVLS